jgi:ParB family chromosome partitioning protein
MANPRKGLGRGLSALIADLGPAEEGERAPDRVLPLASLRPNPDQPRRSFDEDQLRDLAASLQARGVIQPLIVRPDPGRRAPGRSSRASGASARPRSPGSTRSP